MANRRTSRLEKEGLRLLARVWQVRCVVLLAIPYFVLLSWLFVGSSRMDLRPAEMFSIPETPVWEAPDESHWFGTTANGADLFQLSRRAMGNSVAVAVVTSFLGICLALLLTSLFAFDADEKRFRPMFIVSRAGFLLPAMVVLVIFTGGAGGSLPVAMLGLIVVAGLHLAPVLAVWFQEGEKGPDVLAGFGLGLSRSHILAGRVVPKVLRRLVGVFAQLVPVVVLVEMALSFMGFTGDRLSCGAMVAYGRNSLLEAPWLAACPGLLATAVVMILSLLGWLVAKATGSGSLPRIF
ncbi:MAG: hypothetical protein WD342_18145 [Verrucomicrobiales bacterium]